MEFLPLFSSTLSLIDLIQVLLQLPISSHGHTVPLHDIAFTIVYSMPRVLEKIACCKGDPLQSLKKSTNCEATYSWKVSQVCLDTAFRLAYDLGRNSL